MVAREQRGTSTSGAARFPYTQTLPAHGAVGFLPLIPAVLRRNALSVTDPALVDTGSVTHVLPYDLGVQFGLCWNQLPTAPPLGGALAGGPTRLVLLETVVGSFAPVMLGFVWTRAAVPRTILGQTNFFQPFDACFFPLTRVF